MIKFHPLYSSSLGNMFHIESSNTNILLDVGVTYKSIICALNSIDKNITDINAIFITHEHADHIKGLPLLCRKNNIPIYTCTKTAIYLQDMLSNLNIHADIHPLEYGQAVKIKNLEILPFETSHDAVMPCGFKISSHDINISFASDLGYVSNEVYENLRFSDYVILESNYDAKLLDYSKYPFPIKRRIKSTTGHLCNIESANTIFRLVKDGQKKFLLVHLSEKNNNEDIAKATIFNFLNNNDIDTSSLDIKFATKVLSNEVYTIC
ncbi:MAG: MBL fold metallo-hydrolase [Clostridia bacterium]